MLHILQPDYMFGFELFFFFLLPWLRFTDRQSEAKNIPSEVDAPF